MRKQNLPFKRLATEEALTQVAGELKYPSLEALYVAVGEGHVSPQSVRGAAVRGLVVGDPTRTVTEVPLARPVRIGGAHDVSQGRRGHGPARRVGAAGAVLHAGAGRRDRRGSSREGQGVSVHRTDCPNVKALRREPERLIEVTWAEGKPTSFVVAIQVEALDRTRLLSDVATVLSRPPREHPVGDLDHRAGPHHPAAVHVRARRHRAPVERARVGEAGRERVRRLPGRAQLAADAGRAAAGLPRLGRASTATGRRVDRARLPAPGRRRARRRPAARPSGWPRRSSTCGSSPTPTGKMNLGARRRRRRGARGLAVHALRRRAQGPAAVVDRTRPIRARPRRSWRRSPPALERRGVAVGRGVFGADMEVELVNDGPVTLAARHRRRPRESRAG